MTNRNTDYTTEYDNLTPVDEVLLIALSLTDKKKPLTLANAQEALAAGLANRPEMWRLTMAELAEMWVTIIEKEEAL